MHDRMPQTPPRHTETEPDPHHVPTDARTLRERLFAQDRELLEAANKLATTVRAMPRDPEYPDTEPRALLVGWFVRDAVLGLKPKDADLEIYGVSPKRLEQLLDQLFPERVNTVGRAFGVFKINLGEGLDFDVSIPRRESKTGRGHKGFEVYGDPTMTIEDAARRRDFTMNSLAADPLTGEIYDPFGGVDDLRRGTLRVTDVERFQDDPLRVYRALQFAARLDLAPDVKSRELMREMVARGDLDELPKERITDEIKKLFMKAPRPSTGFELAREIGIVKRDEPELHALIDCPQELEWHPEGDAWVHTMMVLDEAAKLIRQPERGLSDVERLQIMLGALCHDLGKPATTALVDGRTRSLGHEEAGGEPTKALCAKWSFAQDDVAAAVAIAREHLKPSVFARAYEKGEMNDANYVNAVRRLLKRIHPMSWKVLIAASEADSRGRAIPSMDTAPYAPGERFTKAIKTNKLDEAPTKPLIQGRDLLELGLKPGPRMGELIKLVEEARDRGDIKTRDEALAFLQGKV